MRPFSINYHRLAFFVLILHLAEKFGFERGNRMLCIYPLGFSINRFCPVQLLKFGLI